MTESTTTKNITGYCEPLSLRAGGEIALFAASHKPAPAELDVVRIICGDPSRSGPGLLEEVVKCDVPAQVELTEQKLTPGSYATVALDGITLNSRLAFSCHFLSTRPDAAQTLLELNDANGAIFALHLNRGHLECEIGGVAHRVSISPIVVGRWYAVEISVDSGRVGSTLTPQATRSPGQDWFERPLAVKNETPFEANFNSALKTCLFAASTQGARFDGRLARPQLQLDDTVLAWDFSREMAGRRIVETSAAARHGQLQQLPARAVTGPDWDGSTQAWTAKPAHYDAIHFHSDDLYDAGWQSSAKVTLPSSLKSGIYAFRLRSGEEVDRIPFFVRPAAGSPTKDVALLMSSCTYMAYANHRMLLEGADFIAVRNQLRPEHEYLRDHREVGLSCYEKHCDGSGVIFSSRRRPVLQLRPGADRWNFTPDTVLNAFLENLDIGHDIVADEDIHFDGADALAPYRVIVTGSHPEYWSTPMLDALETWQRDGGRLLYLGGNGFYWRVAFSDAWPGAIELRRAEDGVRNWQSDPGEYYHAFSGEYGGLWRRLGRPPNHVAGIGFTAAGFEKATHYERTAASYDSRAAWIFDGVEHAKLGTSGLGGGAAGQEIDRFDINLGSPPHALILATAKGFAPDMVRVKEEFEGSVFLSPDDPLVRADIVFYETPGGGAVFSVGSIAWFGAIARNDFDNDIAQVTANVVRRFANPQEFEFDVAEMRDSNSPQA